jgi:ubiquitin conjugation factor E4 B
LPAAEREEAEAEAEQTGDHLRSLLHLAAGTTRTLAVATRDPRAALPFLLPEMAPRVAAALDYFLLYLTGPERRNLKVREPEKYNFRPKRLLRRICAVYLNLFRAEKAQGGGGGGGGGGPGAFARAIAADERSYRPDMFAEAALVLRQFDLMDEQSVRLLEDLAAAAAEAARDRRDEEEAFEGAPEEFLDPILAEVMRDPVRLPTSGKIVDRATITRVLLTDPFDPFSRAPLTAEQLEPVPELKSRLEAWKREQREAKRAGGAAPMERG